MQPIHYGITLALVALLGSGILAWQTSQPMYFVLSIVLVYVFGQDTIGQFSRGSQDDRDPEDYDGTKAGFIQDR